METDAGVGERTMNCPVCDTKLVLRPSQYLFDCAVCDRSWTYSEITKPDLRLVWLSDGKRTFSALVASDDIRDDGKAKWKGSWYEWEEWR